MSEESEKLSSDLVAELNNCETLDALNTLAKRAQTLEKQGKLPGEYFERVCVAGRNRRASLSIETPW